MKRNFRAFTIIETIVSLGVMMIIMGLGIAGIIAFKNSVELQNGYADLVSIVKTLQNQARNGLAIGIDQTALPIVPEVYALDLRTDVINRTGYGVVGISNDGNFIDYQTNNDFPSIGNLNFEVTSGCEIIGFQNFSINIVRVPSGSVDNDLLEDGICTITVSHKSILGSKKTISIDVEKNKIIFN